MMTTNSNLPFVALDISRVEFSTKEPITAPDLFNITNEWPNLFTQVTTAFAPGLQSETGKHHLNSRITTLWILFTTGVIGNGLALLWLWHRRHRKSRVLKIIFGLVTADLSVCFFVMLFSVVYELMEYHWILGNVACKIVMFAQSAVLMASSYMLVLLAVDRHMAVRNPMKKSYPTARLVVLVWAFAATLSLPQLQVWALQEKEREGVTYNTCKTIFKSPDDPKRFVYLLYAALATFCVPFIVTSVAYMRICKKIWDKAREARSDQSNANITFTLLDKYGRVRLQRSGARTLQQAKGKTLRMSITIITMFLLCGFPYFLVGIIQTFTNISPKVHGIFGIFAFTNSSINPYIFLWFSQKSVVTHRIGECKKRICRCFSHRKVDQPSDPMDVPSREGIVKNASSGGLTQDSTTSQATGRASKVTLSSQLSAQQYV